MNSLPSDDFDFSDDDEDEYQDIPDNESGEQDSEISNTKSYKDTDEDTDESLVYEVSYSWDVNDSTSMTVGGFVKEQLGAGIEDLSGLALTTTFSF